MAELSRPPLTEAERDALRRDVMAEVARFKNEPDKKGKKK